MLGVSNKKIYGPPDKPFLPQPPQFEWFGQNLVSSAIDGIAVRG